MIEKAYKILILLLIAPLVIALTVTDVTTPGRTVDGNVVSDYDEDGEAPVFGDVQGSGGNATITWGQVTTDVNGDPITVLLYELRYKLLSDTEYTLITVPPNFTGHSLTLAAGDYQAIIVAVSDSGTVSDESITNFTVN